VDAKKSALIKLIVIESISSMVFSIVFYFLWTSLFLFFTYGIIHGVLVGFLLEKPLESHLIFLCTNTFALSVVIYIVSRGSFLFQSVSDVIIIAIILTIVLTGVSLAVALISKKCKEVQG